MYVTGQHKNKAGLRQTYNPFASTHMVNTQLLRAQNVHTKYCKYFRGFLNSRLLLQYIIPILTQEKGRKKSDFIMCSYFYKNLPVVMYRKFRNVPIFKDIPPICPYFLGFRVGKYATVQVISNASGYLVQI